MAQALPALAPGWAFFLDVDGTLLEYAERPDAVHPDPPLFELLSALHRAAGGALALISGRAVSGLDALFAPLRLPAAGQHGIERRDARGEMHLHAFPDEAYRRVTTRMGAFAALHAGLLFENKGHSAALHYRLAPQLRDAARGAVLAAASELGPRFEALDGKMVVELRPSGRDKGSAIEEFMREAEFAGRVPVFIGDDLSDEFGFGVVNRLGGHSMKVGAGASVARWRLADAAAVRAWLGQWLARYAAP